MTGLASPPGLPSLTMSDVHRADVLTRWIGLLPFPRSPKATPWETGRHDPARMGDAEPAEPVEASAGPAERAEPAVASAQPVEPAEPVEAPEPAAASGGPAAPAEPDDHAVPVEPGAEQVEPVVEPAVEQPPAAGAALTRRPPDTDLAPIEVLPPLVPAPPPLPPRAPDLGRITPAPPLVGRGARRVRAPEPRGAVLDGIEHRPPVRLDEGVGLSRRLRGRLGSRAFAAFFLAVYLLIVLQLIYSLMNG